MRRVDWISASCLWAMKRRGKRLGGELISYSNVVTSVAGDVNVIPAPYHDLWHIQAEYNLVFALILFRHLRYREEYLY